MIITCRHGYQLGWCTRCARDERIASLEARVLRLLRILDECAGFISYAPDWAREKHGWDDLDIRVAAVLAKEENDIDD